MGTVVTSNYCSHLLCLLPQNSTMSAVAEALQGAALNQTTATLIKCTAPSIKASGPAIVKSFHSILLADHPVFADIFPAKHLETDQQVAAVVSYLYQYAMNCDNLNILENEIADIIGLAVNLNLESWQYPLVAKSVVEAIRTVLTDSTAETLRAWMDGLNSASNHFVKLAEEFRKNPYYNQFKLSAKTIDLLKGSAAEIKENGTAIATGLFKILFERYEVFKDLFPADVIKNGKMISVLPHALSAFAKFADNMLELDDTITRIVSRHVSNGVQQWHYPLLEECFIDALNKTLKLDKRPELLQAWKDGFKFLANKVMKLESIKRNNPNHNSFLDKSTIVSLKSSAPLFKTKGTAIIAHFYKVLFQRYPVFKTMFKPENVDSGKQVQAMVVVLSKFAANCDRMEALNEAISHIVGRHVGRKLGVENWHYPLVGECLIEAIRSTLGSEANPAMIAAWQKGYNFLANQFMKMEDAFRENPYYQNWSLSPEHVETIKKSAPSVKAKGMVIANALYRKLFSRHEMFRTMFPEESQQSGKMIQALPSALYDFAVNCDNMGQMQTVVARIASRHVQQGVQGWHYPMLAQCFIEAISQGLGSDATPAVIEAWTEGIKPFANEIMKIENLRRHTCSKLF